MYKLKLDYMGWNSLDELNIFHTEVKRYYLVYDLHLV